MGKRKPKIPPPILCVKRDRCKRAGSCPYDLRPSACFWYPCFEAITDGKHKRRMRG